MSKTRTKPKPRAAKSTAVRDNSWQKQKSEMMRERLLEATSRCLVDIGYAQLTTEKIAKAAGVSRGAMTHQFKSALAVVKAAAQYIVEQRGREFEELISGIEVNSGEPRLEDMEQTVAVLQRYYALPSFLALHELLRAARTDAKLKRILLPLEETLDRSISQSIRARFPFWKAIEETREVIADLLMFTLQGVVLNPVPYLIGDRKRHLTQLLASIALREFAAAYGAASPQPSVQSAEAAKVRTH